MEPDGVRWTGTLNSLSLFGVTGAVALRSDSDFGPGVS